MKVCDDGFFAVVRWCREDVIMAFENRGMTPTDVQVDGALGRISERAMEGAMIERGWDFINLAVEETLEEAAE